MLTAAPPPPPAPLALVAPAEREVSFGRIVGRVPRGRWTVVVRSGTKTLAVRVVAGGSFAHKAGWISGARHDVGLVYWPGGVFVAAVMTWGRSGVGVASDVLAGNVARTTVRRLQELG